MKIDIRFSCPECGKTVRVKQIRCSKCKILLDWEEWSEIQSVEKVVKTIQEYMYFWLVVVIRTVLGNAVFVKSPGSINSMFSMWKDILSIPFFI